MKKLICLAICATSLLMFNGCANGPMRNWFKGSACNTCAPPMGQPPMNVLSGCDTGNCANGNGNFFSRLFYRGNNSVSPCATGNCGNAPDAQPPVFNPNQNNVVPYYNDPNLNSTPNFGEPDLGPTTYQYGKPPIDEIYRSGSKDNTIIPPNFGG